MVRKSLVGCMAKGMLSSRTGQGKRRVEQRTLGGRPNLGGSIMQSPYWKLVFDGTRVGWRRTVALSGALLLCGGCVATAHGSANMEADAPVVFTSEPTLVEVDSGVWVVQDYDQPVYYVNDDYWVFRDGIWYRSHGYEGGWAKVEVTVVPAVIVHRDHHMFVHYHGAATAQRRPAPRRGGPPEH